MCIDFLVFNFMLVKVKQGKFYEIVREFFDFFEILKYFLNIIDFVDILYKIVRDVWYDEKERKELQKLRGVLLKGCNVFRDLLNYFNDSMVILD